MVDGIAAGVWGLDSLGPDRAEVGVEVPAAEGDERLTPFFFDDDTVPPVDVVAAE
jgi:hypothetical protein